MRFVYFFEMYFAYFFPLQLKLNKMQMIFLFTEVFKDVVANPGVPAKPHPFPSRHLQVRTSNPIVSAWVTTETLNMALCFTMIRAIEKVLY